MIGALLGDLWPYLVAAGGAIAALVYAKGRRDASARAAQKAAEKQASDLGKAKEARDEVDSLDGDDVHKRLHEWRRD